MDAHAQARRYEKIDRPGLRWSGGKPKRNWSDVIKHDLKSLGLVEDMARDRRRWRSKIKVADFR